VKNALIISVVQMYIYPLETLTGSVESDNQGKRLDVLSRKTPPQQQIKATSSRQ